MGNSFASFGGNSGKKTASSQAAKSSTLNGFAKPRTSYAQAIHDQLHRDGIKPPQWPAEPGNPKKRKALEDFKDTYKQYLSRVRTSLIKAGLVDDPEVRKSLSDAIDFKGICEEMCPEFEKVSRITEHDVRRPEKEKQADGVEWAITERMVKAFKRSAAGADYPLPMEVRSPAALRRTVDYLVDDLLRSDDRLPALHSFLWDRTRAVRKDFIFQNAMTTDERLDQIYCLETIARFHAVALHLLSQEGVAADDFSEQQEKEQLGKTLLSLMQVYDESKDDGLVIKNEAEFRAYYLLFNAHDPFVKQQLQDWGREIWFDSDEIQTAVSLMESMQNVFRHRGPLRPAAPLTTASNSFTNYFSIVEDSNVSYTMACFAEIHFTEIRRHLLKTINKAYGRVRDHPKDLTAEIVNNILRFDETSQCIDFLEKHDMEFSSDANSSYLLVERRKHIPSPTVKQSHSGQMVERKRGNHSLPDVIHSTIFETASLPNEQRESPDGMFLPSEPAMETGPSQAGQNDSDVTDEESSVSSPTKPSIFAVSAKPPPESSPFSSTPPQTGITAQPEPAPNPFQRGPTPSQPSAEKPSPFQPPSSFSWPAKAMAPTVETGMPSSTKPAFPSAFPPSQTPATGVSPGSNLANAFSSFNKGADSAVQQTTTTAIEPPREQTNAFSGFATSSGNQLKAPSITFTPPTPGRTNSEQQQTTLGPAAGLSGLKNKPFQFPQSTGAEVFPSTGASTKPQSNPQPDHVSGTNTQAPPAVPDIPRQQDVAKETFMPKLPAIVQQSKPKDLMGDFTNWIVLGDDGLIDQFQDAILEHLVQGVFDKYTVEEEERRKKEEDEQSWADALKFRRYNLGLKFFYRWRDITRSLVRKRMGRHNREAIKAYREAQAAQAKATKAAREKTKRKAAEDHNRSTNDATTFVQQLKDRANKRARTTSSQRESSTDSLERALLASGVLAGTSNEREAVSQVVRGDSSFQAPTNPFSPTTPATGFVVPSARPRDPLRPVRTGVSKSIAKPRESAKKQWLRDIASGKHTDGTINGLLSHKAVNNFSQSLPAGTKVTNFTRYQTSSPRSSVGPESQRSKQSSGPKSDYWRLKARGLVTMPDGRALHESLALPMMYDGVRYPGIGDYGLGPGKTQPTEASDLEGNQAELAMRRRSSLQGRDSRWSPRSSVGRASILRRSLPEPQTQLPSQARVDHSPAANEDTSLPADVEATLLEFKALAAEMDEGTNWFREQNDMMLSGQSPFDQHN